MFKDVRAEICAGRRRPSFRSWAAAAAALLALSALVPLSRPAPQRILVKQQEFEAVHRGKVVRLVMAVHRIEKKGAF